MIRPLYFNFIFLVLLVLLNGCKTDSEQKIIDEIPKQEHEVFDFLYGNLSDKEQYYQHFLVEIPVVFQQNLDSLSDWILNNQPGGLNFIGWDKDSISSLKIRLDSTMKIQPIYFVNYYDYLKLPSIPYWEANAKNRDSIWQTVFANDHVGLIDFNENIRRSPEYKDWSSEWNNNRGIQFISSKFNDQNVKRDYEKFQLTLRSNQDLMKIEFSNFDTVQLDRFRTMYSYKGLFVVSANQGAINNQIKGGADFILVNLPTNFSDPIPYADWNISKENREAFESSTNRILSLKSNFNFNPLSKSIKEQTEATRLNLSANSNSLINSASQLLPIKNGGSIYASDDLNLSNTLKQENKLKFNSNSLKEIDKLAKQDGVKVIILPDTINQDQIKHLNGIKKSQNTLICFSNLAHYDALSSCANLLYFNPIFKEKGNFDLLAQQLTGQLSLDGGLVWNDSIIQGKKIERIKLARTSPAFCGLSADTLKKIDYAINGAMNGQAFPGCQVLLSKNGCIFYDKSFGNYTYDRQSSVNNESMYDVASLTKVVATTMVGMLLYEQKGYNLQDSLKDYLPDSLKNYLNYPSTIRNITFQELFTHQSGMPAGFPIIKYMQYTNAEVGRLDKYYCDREDSVYCIEVAENFYLEQAYRDSMWIRLNQIWLDPNKEYKYSDVNMNTLYFIFKSILHNNDSKYGYKLRKDEIDRDLFVEYLYDKLYKPLGMNHTRYKPLKHFNKSQIVPTENERYWRKQLLQGHVHDPNAALYGGVGGNAGIFSTANDLAILCDLLLQKGTYNGQRYFESETVEKFTRAQPNTFRGLGFNKPSINTSAFGCAGSAPQETYGHTGFTGTCFWVDPVNGITYVFLSNRVYPQVNNRIYQYGIRKRVHQFAYDAALF